MKRTSIKNKIVVAACATSAVILLLVCIGCGLLFYRFSVQERERALLAEVTLQAHEISTLYSRQTEGIGRIARALEGAESTDTQALERALTFSSEELPAAALLMSWVDGQVLRPLTEQSEEQEASSEATVPSSGILSEPVPDVTQPPVWAIAGAEQQVGNILPLPPTFDETLGRSVVPLVTSFAYGGAPDTEQQRGVLAALFDLSLFEPAWRPAGGMSGEWLLVGADGTLLAHSDTRFAPDVLDSSLSLTRLIELGPELEQVVSACTRGESGTAWVQTLLEGNQKRQVYTYAPVDDAGWSVAYSVPREEFYLPILPPLLTVACGLLVAVLLMALILSGLLSRLLRPMQELSTATDRASTDGRLTIDARYDGDDELGVLYAGVQATYESLQGYIEDIAHTLGRMSRGDFTVQVQTDYSGDFAPIKTAINHISTSLHGVFSEIDAAARQIQKFAHLLGGCAGQLTAAGNTQEKASTVLSEAVGELRTLSGQSTTEARRGDSSAREARQAATEAVRKFDGLLEAVESLGKTVAQIAEQLSKVDEIAMRTTMLSFNASAEASRAGEKALGFLLVADEMHALSEEGAQAAQKARYMSRMASDTLERARGQVHGLRASLRTFDTRSERLTESCGQLAGICEAQSQLVAQAGKGASGMSAIVQSNARVAEQCTQLSEELGKQARTLGQIVTSFYTKNAEAKSKNPPTIFSAGEEDFTIRDEPPFR